MSTRAYADPAAEPAVATRGYAERCARVSRTVLSNFPPPAPATPAVFVALTLEAWLRQHADALGAGALDDLADALDVDADLRDLRRSR